jgi:hypothetical protein
MPLPEDGVKFASLTVVNPVFRMIVEADKFSTCSLKFAVMVGVDVVTYGVLISGVPFAVTLVTPGAIFSTTKVHVRLLK